MFNFEVFILVNVGDDDIINWEREYRGVFYGGDNYFGFGNFDFEVFWGNLVVVIL